MRLMNHRRCYSAYQRIITTLLDKLDYIYRVSTNPTKEISSRLTGNILTRFQHFLHSDSPMHMLIMFTRCTLLGLT